MQRDLQHMFGILLSLVAEPFKQDYKRSYVMHILLHTKIKIIIKATAGAEACTFRKANTRSTHKTQIYCKCIIFTSNLLIHVRFILQYITLLSWKLLDRGTGSYSRY
jgi:hypothetical protein